MSNAREWDYKRVRSGAQAAQEGFVRAYRDNVGFDHAHIDLWRKNVRALAANGGAGTSLSELYGTWAGKPCVVCGAGPSLREQLGDLRALVGAGYRVIAVDSSHGVLKNAGINPDLTFSLDAQAVVADFFEDVLPGECIALSLVTAPEVREKLQDCEIYDYGFVPHGKRGFWSGVFPGRFSTRYACLPPAPVVTCAAVEAAIWLGCSQIVTVGNDLGWTGYDSVTSMYAKEGSVYRLCRGRLSCPDTRIYFGDTDWIDKEAEYFEVFLTPLEYLELPPGIRRKLETTEHYTIDAFLLARSHLMTLAKMYPDGVLVKDRVEFVDCSGGIVRGWKTATLNNIVNRRHRNEEDMDVVGCDCRIPCGEIGGSAAAAGVQGCGDWR